MNRQLSIRALLALTLLFLMLVQIALQWEFSLNRNRQIAKAFYQQLAEMQLHQISYRINDLLAQYEAVMDLSSTMLVERANREPLSEKQIRSYLFQIMHSFPKVNAIFIGSDNNQFYGYVRLKSNQINYVYVAPSDPTQSIYMLDINAEGTPTAKRIARSGFVLTERRWYADAQITGHKRWDDIFPYYAYDLIALPYSQRLPMPGYNKFVLSMNLFNTQLHEQMVELAKQFPGQIALVDGDENILASSWQATGADCLAVTCSAGLKKLTEFSRSKDGGFIIDGKEYHSFHRPLQLLDNERWRLQGFINDEHFMALLNHGLLTNTLIIISIVLICILFCYRFLRLKLKPLDVLSQYMGNVELNSAPHDLPEPPNLERKNLALELDNIYSAFIGMVEKINLTFQELKRRDTQMALWREVFENAKWGIVVTVGEEPKIIQVNPYAARLLNLPEDKIIDHYSTEFLDEESIKLMRQKTDLIKSGEVVSYNANLIDSASKRIPVTITLNGVFNKKNELLYRVVNIQDRSELTELQRQIRQAQKLESLGLLASSIVHDFNNVLSGILLNVDVVDIKSHNFGAAQIAYELDAIRNSARTAASLIQQLLFFSKKETDVLEPLRLDEVARDVMVMLQTQSRRDVHVELLTESPNCTIKGNKSQLQQLVMNLGNNAIKAVRRYAHDEPYVGIRLWQPTIKQVALDVIDNGPGITRQFQEKMFEPFESGDDTGTGLGLSIVKRVADNHKATIVVDSKIEKGTTITVVFEKCEIDPNVLSNDGARSENREYNEGKSAIFIVDDDITNSDALANYLRQFNFDVSLFSSAGEMLQSVESNGLEDSAVVISDFMMPEINGLQFYDDLRERNWQGRFILMTGHYQQIDIDHCLAQGIEMVLEKPIDLKKLIVLLNPSTET